MRAQSTDVKEILSTLSRESDVLDAAYYGDGVIMDDENRASVGVLVAMGALSPYGEDTFMISEKLRPFLDHCTHRRRGYEVGGDVIGEINRLTSLLVDYETAKSGARAQDSDSLRGEISRCIFSIREQIEDGISRFRHAVETRFSEAKTAEEKVRHNEHYISQVEKTQNALEVLEEAVRSENFPELLREVEREVYREIGTRFQGWVSTLFEIQSRMKEFLFQIREIHEEVKKIYGMSRFLADKSADDILGVLLTLKVDPDWVLRPERTAAEPMPDIEDYETSVKIGEIVSAIRVKPEDAPVSVELEIGTPAEMEGSNIYEEEVSEEEQAMMDFLEDVDTAGEPLSALEWYSKASGWIMYPDEWVEEVLNWAVSDRECGRTFDVAAEPTNIPDCCNVEVEDVIVCRAA